MKQIPETTVGGRIRKARQDAGMTLKALSKAAGVSLNHLSLIERNIKNPSLQLLGRIAQETGVSPTWLFEDPCPSEEQDESANPESGQIANPGCTGRIGNRVRKARLDAKMGLKELAGAIGSPPGHLNRVEHGLEEPSVRLLEAIATATDAPLEWLCFGSKQESEMHECIVTDAGLFLAVAMAKSPSLDENSVSTILNAPTEDVRKLLSGQDVKLQDYWPSAFRLMATRIENPDIVCSELESLARYIRQEARRSAVIAEQLKRAGYELAQPEPETMPKQEDSGCGNPQPES